jgi:hypothetical protein
MVHFVTCVHVVFGAYFAGVCSCCLQILVFNLPVNLAQGLSVLYSYILGNPNAPLTALQV